MARVLLGSGALPLPNSVVERARGCRWQGGRRGTRPVEIALKRICKKGLVFPTSFRNCIAGQKGQAKPQINNIPKT